MDREMLAELSFKLRHQLLLQGLWINRFADGQLTPLSAGNN